MTHSRLSFWAKAGVLCSTLFSAAGAAPAGFPGSVELGEGWWHQPNFGLIYAFEQGWNWHPEHGLFWASAESDFEAGGVTGFVPESGKWKWFAEGYYPWVYQWGVQQGWGYYMSGDGESPGQYYYALGPMELLNPGFEESLNHTWIVTKPVSNRSNPPGGKAFEGGAIVRIDAGGKVEQLIRPEAGRRYRVSAMVYEHGIIGVQDLGSPEPVEAMSAHGGEWREVAVEFVATGSMAFIYAAHASKSGSTWVDAFSVEDVTTAQDFDTAPPEPENRYPSQVLDTSLWKITLPVSLIGKSSPTEVHMPELARLNLDPWFRVVEDEDGYAVAFRANHGGASATTTSSSKNPRSEFREMLPNYTIGDSRSAAGWASNDGKTHTMLIRQKVVSLTSVKPHVVVGQIHDKSDDVTVFRMEATGGAPGTVHKKARIWITKGNTSHGYLVDDDYELGTLFTVKFIVKDGKVHYEYNGELLPYVHTENFSGAYFKAGNYTQSHTGTAPTEDASAYAETWIYDIEITHE